MNIANKISKKSKLAVTDCFQSILQLINQSSYHFIAFLTEKESFTQDWNVYKLNTNCPTLVLTKVNDIHIQLLNYWIDTYSTTTDPAQTNGLISDSLPFIEDHLCDNDLSLELVANHMFVSKYHYSRLFQKQIGIGFKEFVMQKRIMRAKRLLDQGDSVTDTCYCVGYNDLTHFSRVFKRLVGVTPSAYRRMSAPVPVAR
ncbi:helix-turn-helix transcriptional regulator [Marinicrinis sediminis]|uniref:Helix-turn-helix transcriptional regulator n=1 Tax=Marinicrinis sediminis TaxID=1652465 RepID=A0ABW5REI4_9BACL